MKRDEYLATIETTDTQRGYTKADMIAMWDACEKEYKSAPTIFSLNHKLHEAQSKVQKLESALKEYDRRLRWYDNNSADEIERSL